MPQSKDNQIKDVVVGLALGTLANGVTAVTSQKMTFEFAFNGAWRRWNRSQSFPAIRGHDPGNLFWIGVAKSERRRGAVAAWSTERWNSPYITLGDWSVEETLAHIADERASEDDWRELGGLFVAGFKADEQIRDDA